MRPTVPVPAFRRLRGYASDPSLSLSLSTMLVNDLTYQVPWEELTPRTDGTGTSWPRGEYLEIVDYDPASGKFYEPVDLDHPHLLAQDGLSPSVSNPQFHQQMVYAVMMTTIKNFERALGRKVQWAERIRDAIPENSKKSRKKVQFDFVERLRVYPHALRQANAYYDPTRKSLLFGYFTAAPANVQLQLPGATVFTCLSHDIIAHETTHAILDGLHRRYIVATHPDTRAFHEAFADIVALFQHFTFPEVLKHQIAQTRGDLTRQNILGQLAQQFGKATGSYGSLRDAIGGYDKAGVWTPHVPNPDDYSTKMEFHERGSILVGAVFEAFVSIYQKRVERILRIATAGTGILPEGALHPALVDEMAETAAKVAGDVLRICIRALDYCPPMDLTFGDYLRALITADFDMESEDTFGYRVAFVEAFQKRGISSSGVKSMAIEDLLHEALPVGTDDPLIAEVGDFLRSVNESVGYLVNREAIAKNTKTFINGTAGLHRLIQTRFLISKAEFHRVTGLMMPGEKAACEKRGLEYAYLTNKDASYAIDNVWLANRVTPSGHIVKQVIVTLAQKRGVRFQVNGDEVTVDENGFFVPEHGLPVDEADSPQIIFRGGCTLVFDLDSRTLRYAIKKDIDDRDRMVRQYRYENGMSLDDSEAFFDRRSMNAMSGPFAMMHSHSCQTEDSHVH